MTRPKRNWLRHLAFAGAAVALLGGCDFALLDPRGEIGVQNRALIVSSTLWMLVVVLPVIVMALLFPWWFRAGRQAKYTPDWESEQRLEAVVWGIPFVIVTFMAVGAWTSTHELDPKRPIESDHPPIKVEVVALDWKWLFVYPELGIASVNEMAMPVNVPVAFSVTSDSVMNSFFIPRLGSQIYAMAGMTNRLHLIADKSGEYPGISANYSGRGFSGMRFTARAMPQEGFDAWVAAVRASGRGLDWESYAALAAPSESHPVEHYASVVPGFYESLIDKYRAGTGPGAPHRAPHGGHPVETKE